MMVYIGEMDIMGCRLELMGKWIIGIWVLGLDKWATNGIGSSI